MIFKIFSCIDPYNRELSILNRKKIRITNTHFDDFFGNIFWPKKAKEIGIHGGLGDVILLLPYLKKYKERFPHRTLKIIYTDVRTDSSAPQDYGLGKTRLENTNSGALANPIADFLENITFIDQKEGGDPTNADDYWHPDVAFRRKWGKHLNPTQYRTHLFPEIFKQEDITQAATFLKQNNIENKFVIAFHLRRGSDKIFDIAKRICADAELKDNVVCIFLGSSRNEPLPDLTQLNQIDLTDNYTKGINLRVLYQIVMHGNLFIGGRGSFEHFFWLAEVPSINLMDREGYEGNNAQFGTWMPEFWQENKFKEKLFYDQADPASIINDLIKPYFKEWQKTKG